MTREEATQLPLSLEPWPAYGDADFLPAPCNQAALAWIERWPDWGPATAVTIHGPAGCGKTHLAQIFARRADATVLGVRQLLTDEPDRLIGEATACAVDDADAVVGLGAERPLLHLYNTLVEAGRGLLLTAASPPARWGISLADLASRLQSAPAIAIDPPDDALIGAMLGKLFHDRQVQVSDDLIEYLVVRIERSFAAVRSVVSRLDAASLGHRRRITVALAREILRDGGPDET